MRRWLQITATALGIQGPKPLGPPELVVYSVNVFGDEERTLEAIFASGFRDTPLTRYLRESS